MDFSASQDAKFNYELKKEEGLGAQIGGLRTEIEKELNAEKRGLDGIICAAGGFIAGSAKEDEILSKWGAMSSQLVEPALLTAHLSSLYLKPGGLCILTGAFAAYKDTGPEMLAYHTGKVATHNIGLNLAASDELAEGATVLTILP